MPTLDREPCSVEVPIHRYPPGIQDNPPVRMCRRDFSVWLTRTALFPVASNDQWGDDAWAEECADAWLALPPKAWGWQ